MTNSNTIRNRVINEYGSQCYWCKGKIDLESDPSTDPFSLVVGCYFIPKKYGGTRDLWNTRPMHRKCHEENLNTFPDTKGMTLHYTR